MRVIAIDHVQLAMPAGKEGDARAFYEGLLGIPWVEKPANLAKRGGCWFESNGLRIHLGVDPMFAPATKAHPGLIVDDLAALVRHLEAHDVRVVNDEPLKGFDHVYVDDPFGNRIELMQPSLTVLFRCLVRGYVNLTTTHADAGGPQIRRQPGYARTANREGQRNFNGSWQSAQNLSDLWLRNPASFSRAWGLPLRTAKPIRPTMATMTPKAVQFIASDNPSVVNRALGLARRCWCQRRS